MNNIVNMLNSLFLVSMILAGIFLVLSAILFFVFDIRSIFNIRTGRAKKRTVQEMQKANNLTDVLKVSKTGQRTRRGSVTGPLGTAPTSKKLRYNAEITPPQTDNTIPPLEEATTPETSVLKSQPANTPEISGLKQKDAIKSTHHNFIVTKRIMLINTEEIIP